MKKFFSKRTSSDSESEEEDLDATHIMTMLGPEICLNSLIMPKRTKKVLSVSIGQEHMIVLTLQNPKETKRKLQAKIPLDHLRQNLIEQDTQRV